MRTSKGFSLTELLVVVGIILLLSGIIYAVMAPARMKAKQTTCMGNLRQLYAALSLYSSDYSDSEASEIMDGHIGLPAEVKKALAPYGITENQFYCPDLPISMRPKLYSSYLFTGHLLGLPAGNVDVGGTENFRPSGIDTIKKMRDLAGGNLPLVRCGIHDELHYQHSDTENEKRPFMVYVTTSGSIKAERASFEGARPFILSMIPH